MTRQQAFETERMLGALRDSGVSREDAETLRRISMTLHRWHEMMCGDSNATASYVLVRGRIENKKFVYAEGGAPFLEFYNHHWGSVTHSRVADRERGALKRLEAVMSRYPGMRAYVQGDPRGAALYILRPGDVPAGGADDVYYSRGIAVYR